MQDDGAGANMRGRSALWVPSCFLVQSLGLEFGIRGWSLGSRASGFGFRVSGFGIRDSGFGFLVFGFQVSGFDFRVSGFEFRVLGLRFEGQGLTASSRRTAPSKDSTPAFVYGLGLRGSQFKNNYFTEM